MPAIRCEVSGIIDNTTVVLSAGRESLVTKGMRFVIYAETEHISDSSGNDLGMLEIPKAEVEVIDVQDKLSIARNTAIAEKEYSGPLSLPDMYKPRIVRYVSPLNIADGQTTVRTVDLAIRRGNKARSIQ